MTRLLVALLVALLLALVSSCQTDTIELREDHPDARVYDAARPDAAAPRCVCLRACIDSRDCGGIGTEICDTGAAVCEESEPLTECNSSAMCTDRVCVRADDPAIACP